MDSLLGNNFIISLWIAYAAGVATSLTPCIYPLIPVTVGIIGGQAVKKTKSFTLSLLYVLGLAVTYMVLGVVASVGGQVFGLTAYNPWVNIFIGVILLIFALSMFDVIRLPLIGSFIKPGNYIKKGIKGVFIMGLLSGLVAAPCSTPVLGSILTVVAVNKDIFRGGLMLFVYGFGSGTLLIIIGTFAGIASGLPKSGKWMNIVKSVFGSVIILAACYFFYRAVKGF